MNKSDLTKQQEKMKLRQSSTQPYNATCGSRRSVHVRRAIALAEQAEAMKQNAEELIEEENLARLRWLCAEVEFRIRVLKGSAVFRCEPVHGNHGYYQPRGTKHGKCSVCGISFVFNQPNGAWCHTLNFYCKAGLFLGSGWVVNGNHHKVLLCCSGVCCSIGMTMLKQFELKRSKECQSIMQAKLLLRQVKEYLNPKATAHP